MGEINETESNLAMELVPPSSREIAVHVPLEIEGPPPPKPTRKRRKKSLVWEHFTIEPAGGESTRACCKLCKQTFAYSTGTKVAGTSHLKRHITLGSCPKIKSMERENLELSSGLKFEGYSGQPKRRYRTTLNSVFDQQASSENLAKMIILHEYPLHMVEQAAVIAFARGLQSRFRMPTFSELEGEIFSVYHKEKQNLVRMFANMPGRICLTISMWTTSQTLGYICLNGQFIDRDWKLHRRMLNFMMVSSPHSENAVSEAIAISLSEWNMKTKLFTITLDNYCSSHDTYSTNLRDHLSNKNMLTLKGQLFVIRCYTNILNVVAQDLIASIHGIIYNIRESVKYVKASPSHEEKFAEIALQLEIPSTKSLSLDVTMEWDTTYHMLVAALEYKQAFTVLETCDDNYNEAPSFEDWRKVEVVSTYLRLLHDSAHAISSTTYLTANIFFQEAWKIQLELTHNLTHDDHIISNFAREMHEKFDKYWKDCNLVMAMAVVMDPRFKMKYIEFSFSKLYGAEALKHVKAVDDAIRELYEEYVSQPLPLTPTYEEQQQAMGEANDIDSSGHNHSSTPGSVGNELLDFDIFISETAVNQNLKPEIEQYLEENVMPRCQEFDILNWWKLNTIKYPTLSKMARDLLAIPVSVMGPGGSLFGSGMGGRVLDEYRSSLRPEMVDALFCCKDWLQYSTPTPVEESSPSNAIVKMEY